MFADDMKLFRKVTCTADVSLLQADLQRLRVAEVLETKFESDRVQKLYHDVKNQASKITLLHRKYKLKQVEMIHDLGVVMDAELTFEPHVNGIIMRANIIGLSVY